MYWSIFYHEWFFSFGLNFKKSYEVKITADVVVVDWCSRENCFCYLTVNFLIMSILWEKLRDTTHNEWDSICLRWYTQFLNTRSVIRYLCFVWSCFCHHYQLWGHTSLSLSGASIKKNWICWLLSCYQSQKLVDDRIVFLWSMHLFCCSKCQSCSVVFWMTGNHR